VHSCIQKFLSVAAAVLADGGSRLGSDIFRRGGETTVNDDRNNGVVVVIGVVQWS